MAFNKADVDTLLKRIEEKRGGSTPSSVAGSVKVRANMNPRERKMNKTERRYEEYLAMEKRAGRVHHFGFEAIKIRISNDCFWSPDFMVVYPDGTLEFHDTKAFWKSKGRVHIEDDAQAKMKSICESLPWFNVVAVWEQDGKWVRRKF